MVQGARKYVGGESGHLEDPSSLFTSRMQGHWEKEEGKSPYVEARYILERDIVISAYMTEHINESENLIEKSSTDDRERLIACDRHATLSRDAFRSKIST